MTTHDISVIIVAIMAVVTFGSVYYLIEGRKRKLGRKVKKTNAEKKMSRAAKRASGEDTNIFEGTSVYLDKGVYDMIRYTIIGAIVVAGLMPINFTLLISALCLALLTAPVKKTKNGVKLPFGRLCDAVYKKEKEDIDSEIMTAISTLKNIVVQQREQPVGSDYIIEHLAESAEITKPAYLRLLNKLRVGRMEEGEREFAEFVGTELGKGMAHILAQLDELNPMELEEAIESRQVYIKEVKKTRISKSGQLGSDIAYIPVVFDMMVIFMNFMVVAFYIVEAEEIKKFLF